MNGNVITMVGNITRDPELKFTRNGQAMLRVGIADNHGWKDKEGEWQTKVSFIDCVAWGQFAENLAETLEKGMRVVVTGRIDMQSWTNDNDEKRTKLELEVEGLGPDLRWATATVERNERDDGNKGRKSSGQKSREQEYDEDEEPF